MVKKILKIKGMHCTGCAFLIEGNLEDIGVKAIASYQKGEVAVEFEEKQVKEELIVATIKKAGYEVVV